MVLRRLLASCLLLLASLLAAAQGLLPVPELTARVVDQTGTLGAQQRQALEDKLAAFEQGKGAQIVVLLVPTTQPEDIASYANRIANAWKIGRKDVGDGIVVIVAKNDRRVRIEVAKTLEGAVPDLAAKGIIDEAITPRFRQGDFAGGLEAGVDQLIARISGEPLPAPQTAPHGGGQPGFDWFDLAIFLFFAVPIAGAVLRGIFGRRLGSLLTGGGAGVLALLFTASVVVAVAAGVIALLVSLLSGAGPFGGRRSGWGGPVIFPGGGGFGGGRGGGFGGGGGFSSGGGGDFGGGGASGDW
ncbi:MAG: TPM domain-containing protein [Burkholderiales bacterium]|nr:TPM domain-containing protein [Burkholderiales bacterium]